MPLRANAATLNLQPRQRRSVYMWLAEEPSGRSGARATELVQSSREAAKVLHPVRVEALTRQMLRQVKDLELKAWSTGPEVYDVRLSVKGWRLRVEVAGVS